MMPPPIAVASLGFENSLILMVLALVVFGPRRLPEIGRQIGKLMYEVRKASNDFKFQMEEELRKAEDDERRKKAEEKSREQGTGNREQISAPAISADSQVPEANPQPSDEGLSLDVTSPGAPESEISQVSEARAGAPTSAVASPYPGEGVYPEIDAAAYQASEPHPLIQPPSTGEPVAAEAPGRMAANLNPPAAKKAVRAPRSKPDGSAPARAKKAAKQPQEAGDRP